MDFIRAPYILEFLILCLISLHRTNLCLFKSLILYVKDVITGKSLRMTITACARYIPFIPLRPFFNSSVLPHPALCLERLTCMNFVRAPLSSGFAWQEGRGQEESRPRVFIPQAPSLSDRLGHLHSS